MSYLKMTEIPLHEKRLLIREDFNVPIENGIVTSDARLLAVLPTLRYALQKSAAVILLSHLGRPQEGQYEDKFSLASVAERLSVLCGRPVRFVRHWLEGIDVAPGEIVLCENVRFNVGEKSNDAELSQKIARLCDIFVMDAFATAHRAEASTHGVAKFSPIACAGPLLIQELDALSRALENPKRPLVAIVGGSKVSTKLVVLKSLLTKVDQLIVGGGIANTFLAAKGFDIGKSLYEPGLLSEAKSLLAFAEKQKVSIVLPEDVQVSTEFSKHAEGRTTTLENIHADEMILDVGKTTANRYAHLLQEAGTILWNGPVGVFEFPAFSKGTESLAKAIAMSQAFSLAGGGDTLAAIDQFQVSDQISYISTGGGAFLEFVEGKSLPAVEMLMLRSQI